MKERALKIVENYVKEHLDKSDGEVAFETYIVWMCKTLQNWKFLISTSLSDGMYYELTFNGDTKEWYLDAYKKFENRVIVTKAGLEYLKSKQPFNIIYGARSNGKEYVENKYKVFFDECIRKNKEPDDQISIYDFDINGEKESDGK
jgi:hypothetical protein